MTVLHLTTEAHLAAGGHAVARADDGRVVFVEGAAPDEEVRAEIVKDNPRFLRARVREVVRPSRHRVVPRCPHFDECGGCSLQHISADAQLQSKRAAVLTSLRKLGGVVPDRVLPAWQGAPYAYRGRVRWAAAPGGGLGYRQERGHRVVPVSTCPVLHPELQAVLPKLRGPQGRSRAQLNAVTDGERVAAAWTGSRGPQPPIDGLEWVGPPAPSTQGDSGLRSEGVHLHPLVFSQANPAGNRALKHQLQAWLPERRFGSAVELYAGSGNFTLALAERVAHVVTYEVSTDAVALAQRVVPPHVDVRVGTAEEALEKAEGSVDVVLVDPPRAGLSSMVADGLARWATERLLYVSCDPATFARDAGRWARIGWRLEEVRVFDLYPQTPHVEVVGAFTRGLAPG